MNQKPKVYVVDDDQDLVDVVSSVLESSGYEVASAASGREAIEKVAEVSPDIIVLDVMMEDVVAGFRVMNFLRNYDDHPENKRFSTVPILMLTSIQQRTGMKFAQDQGSRLLPIDAFLEKPVKPKVLLEKLKELLARTA
jgi:CheY-like chemotaxis protein